MLFRPAIALLTAASAALGVPAAKGMERVTLRNGFSYDCARREPLDGSHVRLYLSPRQSGETVPGYIDLPSDAIVAVERLPDSQPVLAKQPGPSVSGSEAAADVHALLRHAGQAHNIDAELLASIVHAESGGRARAISRAGAEGLMQLMPGTAQAMGVADAFRPEDNIAGGASYFDSLLMRYKDNLALALAAYNAGPGAVDRFHGVPPYRETRAYVARVMREFKRRKLALEDAERVSR